MTFNKRQSTSIKNYPARSAISVNVFEKPQFTVTLLTSAFIYQNFSKDRLSIGRKEIAFLLQDFNYGFL